LGYFGLVVLLTVFPKSFHSGFFLELVLLDGFLLIPLLV